MRRATLAACAVAAIATLAVAAALLGAALVGPELSRGPATAVAAPRGLPLTFERNRGQADPEAHFVAHGPSGTLYLTTAEAILALQARGHVDLLRMRLLGARRVSPAGSERRPGVANYLVGDEPGAWRRGIPGYGRVSYRGVYRGIDLVFHAARGELEYDFDVAPGADPKAIAVELRGARSLRVDARGRLVVKLAHRTLVQHAPRVYQLRGGVRRAVTGRYVVRGATRVGFAIGRYDRAAPLVIDPAIAWSTVLGGSANDVGTSIAVDAHANTYIAGSTSSTDLELRRPLRASSRGRPIDAFVAKIDPAGRLVYATYLGGTGYTDARGIAVDRRGRAYVTGGTGSPDFPVRRAVQPDYGGGPFDGWVAELSAAGSSLVFSTFNGGPRNDRGYAIAVGADGTVVAVGRTAHDSFPSKGALVPSPQGGAFVTKLAPRGRRVVYSTVLGGKDPANSSNTAFGVALDRHLNAYVTGITAAPDFPTVRPIQARYGGGRSNAFVTRIDARGTAFVYSTYLGGHGEDEGLGIVVDRAGRAYVTGQTTSPDFPLAGGPAPAPAAAREDADAFIAKLAPGGASLAYSVRLGGHGDDAGNAIAVDRGGTAFVAGTTASPDFPAAARAGTEPRPGGPSDAFVTTFAPDGSPSPFSLLLGGGGAETGLGIALDAAGDPVVTGQTESADYPLERPIQPPPAKRDRTAGGGGTAFVTRLTTRAGR